MGARQALGDNQTTGAFLGPRVSAGRADRARRTATSVAAFEAALAAGERLFVADLGRTICWRWRHWPTPPGLCCSTRRAEDDELRTEACSREHPAHRAVAGDEGRCARPVSGLEAVDALVPGARLASRGQGAGRGLPARRDALRRQDRRDARVRGIGGARRTDTGHVQVQQQMPVFTQGAAEHDVLVVADESEVFGDYMPYRTWEPRPVVGTQRAGADRLEPGARAVGRHPAAAALRGLRRPADDRARLPCLARRARARRGGDPQAEQRPGAARLYGRAISSRSPRSRAKGSASGRGTSRCASRSCW